MADSKVKIKIRVKSTSLQDALKKLAQMKQEASDAQGTEQS